ncbi:methyl-accepting chemotaxis protein [Rhodobacter aestuarii]|uniref:Methyl-accepting chemotaxis protein n=1 Tax=Rhodobacter aestuarii TaxID=453582 RepID=A0A1N7QDT2_9RHOB|nr:hypothetical protein [Rhodobacter aestuarii]PTV93568.1 methyl-accepting chemotaxis protein [Rhodobacter aestuarii]SIT20737.1 Methyl-accepting chemotaxis protein [Rhodobacter aestuarii]
MTSAKSSLCRTAETGREKVREVRERTEAHFLTTGSALMSVCDRFETVERPIGAISELASAGEVQGLAATIRRFETMLHALLASVQEARTPLSNTLETARTMHSAVAQLSRTIRTMNIVALNARVTVAPMVDVKDSMTVFTRDAAELVQQAFGKLVEINDALAHLDEAVEVARGRSADLGRQLDERAAVVLGDIFTGLGQLEDHIGALTTQGGKLSRGALTIRDAVSKSVFALQSGDAMRQRLEHIEEMFEAVCDRAPGLGLQAALLALVQRQMFDATERHAPQVSLLERQLRLATNQTTTFLAEVDDLFSPGRTGVVELLRSFTQIETVLADVSALQQDLGDDALRLSAGVERVQGLVQEIGALEARMNLIGINAVIACSSLGQDGLPLKVIAHQLRDLVEQSSTCVVHMHRDLDAMRKSASTVAEMLDQQAQETQKIRGGLELEVTQGLEKLRSALADARDAINANQSQLSGGIAAGVKAMEDHQKELRQLVDEVAMAISREPRTRKFILTKDEVALIAHLRDILSIEIERNVLDTWLGTIGVDPETIIGTPTGTSDDEVTLFDDFDSPPPSSGSDDDFLFFDEAI